MSYAGRTKYDEPGRAARYAARSPRRDRQEWALLERMLAGLRAPPATAWDVPCGTGRIAERLLARGIPTRCGDLSPAMRAATSERLDGRAGYLGVEALDLEALPEPPPAPAPLVVCFRLWHHLPTRAHRQRVLTSLRVLSSGDVFLSFHHPVSVHNLRRRLRGWLGRRPSDRHTLAPRRLRTEAAAAGLEVVGFAALAPYRRELWLAHLRVR